MEELVQAFMREKSVVNHHIASFDDFLPTHDNPDSRMQRIVDNLRIDDEAGLLGIIKLDLDKTGEHNVEIHVGRRRDPATGEVDPNARPTIHVELPIIKEANIKIE